MVVRMLDSWKKRLVRQAQNSAPQAPALVTCIQAAMKDEISIELLQCTARLVVDEGMDYGAAKRAALKQLGLPGRTSLPDNLAVEDAVREHIALFCADTQSRELHALRAHALGWMQRLADFRPHLGGAVWRGTATRLTDLRLTLFVDDPKAVEIMLINQQIRFQVARLPSPRREDVHVLSFHSSCPRLGVGGSPEEIGVHLLVCPYDDLRGALLPDARGLSALGNSQALERVMNEERLS
jgi:hypothetical protein